MKNRERLGISLFLAITLAACGSLSDDSRPTGGDVAQILSTPAKACRFITNAIAESATPQDRDLYTTAIQRLQRMAREKSGNALVVRSVQSRSAPDTSKMTIAADVYVCQPERK